MNLDLPDHRINILLTDFALSTYDMKFDGLMFFFVYNCSLSYIQSIVHHILIFKFFFPCLPFSILPDNIWTWSILFTMLIF